MQTYLWHASWTIILILSCPNQLLVGDHVQVFLHRAASSINQI